VKRSRHRSRLIKVSYSLGHVGHSLTLAMDFSNLWKRCYRLTHASFHTVYTWLTAISSVTVPLHYLPICLCSTVTCMATIQWLKKTGYTPKTSMFIIVQ